ncbi:MAG: bifunctional phosphopantothenoylcysteine decarboxylase/phosphopantothenate--cysteine ligase CoaBC [Gemmatimonadetes bacterium]|nr:bifunctional phosphopantothenoylcysteine decarboxylase/phosphopantothenate--cysteine ligase CoaBC [Gemmatimonadota bacterium]NNM06033.1 bifunctional phosphopantothenoylcysteine decarboxylase/phosphopantothenate--cysteine ligase CoaBC [Gemmatimonadota bacterium]
MILGVTGGIAAYKSVQVARDLTRLGTRVDVVMTAGAQRFVQPLSFQGVTGREVFTDMFSGSGPAAHIRLGMEAEALVVAPATANFLSRAAQGAAQDLLSTTLLVTRAPVILCPAMNERMFSHPQTQANLRHVQDSLGYKVSGPGQGPLAVGEGTGHGRMLEPEEIVQHVGRALGTDSAWEGRAVVVTAGPTREPLDPVRFLGNRSSGRMGFALASAAWRRGASVRLVTGPTALQDPAGVEVVRVETGEEMKGEVLSVLPDADVLVFAAAVSDFKPADANDQKLKRSRKGEGMEVRLDPTADIALSTMEGRKTGAVALGFALETEDLLPNARKKLKEKGFHLIAANSATEEGSGFEVDTNRVTILDRSGGMEELPILPKEEVAEKLLDRLTRFLQGGV